MMAMPESSIQVTSHSRFLIPSHESLTPSLEPLRSLRFRPVLPRIDVGEERDFERDDGFHRFF